MAALPTGLPEAGDIDPGKDETHLRAVSCKRAAAVQAPGRLAFSEVQVETYGSVHHGTTGSHCCSRYSFTLLSVEVHRI